MSDTRPLPGSLRAGAATKLIGWLVHRDEAQRARLAHVLHRDVAGTLAAVRMDIARIVGGLAEEQQPLRDALRRADELVEQAIRAARCEMQRLHPALIDHFGLAAAVRHRVDEASRAADFLYTLELVEQVDGVELPLQLAAYRAVEALLDAPALREITIRLESRREHFVLKAAARLDEAVAATATASSLLALRTWLESLGASWLESAALAGRRQFEIRLPRTASAAVPGTA